jgi:hypothetical protein
MHRNRARPIWRAFALKETQTMTAITLTVPLDVVEAIDHLRALEMLSRAAWLRREIVLAIRASRIDERQMEALQ